MKCRDCNCCHEVPLTRWSSVDRCYITKYVHKCYGVKEPFIIEDINVECTEYPERRNKVAEMVYRTNFHINVRPYSIDFECPYCKSTAEIKWTDLNVPDYWGDDWGAYECPECGEWVLLGDYDYD